MNPSKQERLKEFVSRVTKAPPASSRDEARRQMAEILNAVEDELTDIPFDPDRWQSDGRMYPPKDDSIRDVDGFPLVKRFRSRGHNTFIGDNGCIEIRMVQPAVAPRDGTLILSKPGSDGRTVWNQGRAPGQPLPGP